MEQNAQDLKTFLEVYPNIQDCSIQIFMDDKTKSGGAKIIEMSKITDINKRRNISKLNREGYGIFFSVNSMIKGKRSKDSVTNINAWACECDELSKEEQKINIDNCPLKPSLVIESKKSYHMYWFAKTGTKDNRSKICRGLKNYFSGDRAIANDISRVLRIPGFSHCKDYDNPYLCKITECNGKYYTEDEMLSSYKDTTTDNERLENIRKLDHLLKTNTQNKSFNDSFRCNAAELDSETMLQELSGTQRIKYEEISFKKNSNGTKQIICNGRITGNWIDKNGKIGSTDKGGPTRLQRIQWYDNIDRKELYKWLLDRHPELKPKTTNLSVNKQTTMVDTTERQEEIIFQTDKDDDIELDLEQTPMTRGLEKLDDEWGMLDYGKFIVFAGRSGCGKTEFCLFNARKNADRGIKTSFVTLEMSKKELLTRTATMRAGISKRDMDHKTYSQEQERILKNEFQKLKKYPNLSVFTTNNRTVEGIIELIKEEYKCGTRYIFLDNLGFFVRKDTENEFECQERACRELKQLTNVLPISIVLIHHLKKGNDNNVHNLVRGSGKIVDDADYLLTIGRQREFSKIGMQKNRKRGATGEFDLEFKRGEFYIMEEEINDTIKQNPKPF